MTPLEMNRDYIGVLHVISFIFSEMIPDNLEVDEDGKLVESNKD